MGVSENQGSFQGDSEAIERYIRIYRGLGFQNLSSPLGAP